MADNKAYAIFSTQKVHSKTMLRQMYEHHYRIKDCPNADKDMKEENDYRVVPKGDFIQAFDKRLQELDYYKTHNFRSNGVMGYDCLMAYSRKANNWLDVELLHQRSGKAIHDSGFLCCGNEGAQTGARDRENASPSFSSQAVL